MYHIYFEGRGEMEVNTKDYDKAIDILCKALADAEIDLELDVTELRDEDGNEIEC